jgi:hypothetical protein
MHNKLFYKAMYLKAELEEVTAIFEECKKKFLDEVSKNERRPTVGSLAKASSHLSKNLKDICLKKNAAISNNLKKLYRRIMLKAHPDKLITLEDENIKKMYSNICSKAMKAMDEEDWFSLFSAAKDLDIHDVDITDEHIDMLTNDCEKIELQISVIKKSLPWMWFHYDAEVKEKCLKQYFEN